MTDLLWWLLVSAGGIVGLVALVLALLTAAVWWELRK